MNANKYCIIMAGGIGSRFWPMSTQKHPKQFHDILGTGKTLIQQTFERMTQTFPKENIYIITNKEYVELTHNQLPEINIDQIIGEPNMMNTAPCVLYMCMKIHQINSNAKILIAPSDHIILDSNRFTEIIDFALEESAKDDILITLGISPTRADTGYGYIQFVESKNPLKKVKTFTEKPNAELAESFISSGDFLWNAGIFTWSSESILRAFELHQHEMFTTFKSIENTYNTAEESTEIAKIYPTVSKISIDYAIMEKSDNVYVIPSSFGWSDLGTWASLFENSEKNQEQNSTNSKLIFTYESSNNIIRTTNANKAIIIDDLQGYIVADTEHALMICPIEKDQKVKDFVQDLKLNKGEEFL